MIKNNKGFTLVELLAVIVLIGLLIGIGIPGVMRIRENIQKKALDTKEKLIEQNGVLWGQDNKTLLQAEENCDVQGEDGTVSKLSCAKITIKELIDEDYMDGDENNKELKNPVNDKDFYRDENCYVHVYRKNNRVYAYFGENSCHDSYVTNTSD